MPEARCGFDDAPGGASGSALLIAYGPTLLVDIGFDPNFKSVNPSLPIPGIKGLHALVDTGAATNCIDGLLAAHLNLPIVDRQRISGISGIYEVNVHLAQVHLPLLNYTLYGAFAAVDLAAGGQPHRALIGRTFLQNYTMVYEGRTGTVTLSWP